MLFYRGKVIKIFVKKCLIWLEGYIINNNYIIDFPIKWEMWFPI